MRCDEGWHTVLWCLVRVASALGLFGSVLWFNWFCVCVCFLSISKMDLSFHSLCVVVGIPSSTQLAPRHTPQCSTHPSRSLSPPERPVGCASCPRHPHRPPWLWTRVTMEPLELHSSWCHRQGGQLLLLPNVSQEKSQVLSGFRFSISPLVYHSFSVCLSLRHRVCKVPSRWSRSNSLASQIIMLLLPLHLQRECLIPSPCWSGRGLEGSERRLLSER